MANQINLITEYTPRLDEKYRKQSVTGILEAPKGWYRNTQNAKTIEIAKIDCDGMGDYSRANGYSDGDMSITWEQHTFTHDRGRRFSLDVMDEQESLAQEYFQKIAYIEKHYVIPEIDATRFATMASTDGIQKATEGYVTESNVKKAITDGLVALEDAECDSSNLVIYATPRVKQDLENALPRQFTTGVNKYNQKVDLFNDIPIISVPKNRFYTKIDLKDGTSVDQKTGGYAKYTAKGTGDVAGKDINFMIVDTSSVMGIVKHTVKKVMTPEQNPFKDGYLVFFRYYHDLFVLENRANGIYLSNKAS